MLCFYVFCKDLAKKLFKVQFSIVIFFHCSIDATEESGKLGRLLNHSKTNSNCHPKIVIVQDRPCLILFASRNIATGEELQYDYGDRSKVSIDSHPWLKY